MVFSQKLFNENDPICRSKIFQLLGTSDIYDNKDEYGVDILLTRKDLFQGLELERLNLRGKMDFG